MIRGIVIGNKPTARQRRTKQRPHCKASAGSKVFYNRPIRQQRDLAEQIGRQARLPQSAMRMK
jgi:hypothetical protein